jgi:hypothetical protein
MRRILIMTIVLIGGCGFSPKSSQYAGPPRSDDEMFKRIQEAAAQGATFDNISDRAGFSPNQKTAFERGRAQGFGDIYGN